MSLLSNLNTGYTGLQVASDALSVVGHNTANATTEGYTRQQILTSSATPYSSGNLWIGAGVTADNIYRVTDVFIAENLTDARGNAAEAEASYKSHQIIEAAMNTGDSVGDSLSAFFDALDELTSEPGNTGHRMAVVSAGETLTNTVSSTFDQLTTIQTSLTDQVEALEESVNSALDRIAQLNGLIVQGGSSDLADERDALINELADKIGVTVDVSSSNGQATVFLGGHAIVQDDNAREFTVTVTAGVASIEISADSATITVTDDVGGEIGGLLTAYDTAQSMKDDLDTFVDTFATAFNDQHILGFDETGTPGIPFFTFSTTTPGTTFAVDPSFVDDPGLLALADDATASVGDKTNLEALSDLQHQGLFGGETPEDFIEDLYTQLGNITQNAELSYTTELAALEDAVSMQDATSGVNLDEEAADLLEWQAAYQASARIITATNALLDELMNIV